MLPPGDARQVLIELAQEDPILLRHVVQAVIAETHKEGELSGSPSSLTFKGSGITGDDRQQLVFERCAGKAARRPVYGDRVRELMEGNSGDRTIALMHEEYYRLCEYDIARIQRAAQGDELKSARVVPATTTYPLRLRHSGRAP